MNKKIQTLTCILPGKMMNLPIHRWINSLTFGQPAFCFIDVIGSVTYVQLKKQPHYRS